MAELETEGCRLRLMFYAEESNVNNWYSSAAGKPRLEKKIPVLTTAGREKTQALRVDMGGGVKTHCFLFLLLCLHSVVSVNPGVNRLTCWSLQQPDHSFFMDVTKT